MRIVGHRGARGEAPENTLGGFSLIKQQGINCVEFDVRQLRDGQLVVIHDDNLKRTTGHPLLVQNLGEEQRQKYSHTHLWPAWANLEPTPLLSEVLNLIKDFQHIEVEIKNVIDATAAERLINALLPTLSSFLNLGQYTITSFDIKVLQAAKQLAPAIPRGLLVEWPLAAPQIAQIANAFDCQRVGLKDNLITEAALKTLQPDFLISAWTVNDLTRAKQLQDWGVDALITDYPIRMQPHFMPPT